MENQDQNTPVANTVITPTPQGPGASYTDVITPAQSSNPTQTAANPAMDAPIIPSENSLETPEAPDSNVAQPSGVQTTAQITSTPIPQQPRRSLNRVIIVVAGIVILLLVAVVVAANIISRRQSSQLQSPAESVNEQGITLGSATPDTLAALQLEGSQEKLIVNGDIILSGRLSVGSGNFYGQFVVNNLTANRSYTLPDADGAICLDTNNCNFALEGSGVDSVNGVNGILTLGQGLGLQGTTIVNTQTQITANEVISAMVFQGTNNQVGVTTNGNVISFTTPQDIGTASNPVFSGVSVANLTVTGGNASLNGLSYTLPSLQGNGVLTNNGSGGLTWTAAGGLCPTCFVNGGNDFGGTATLGTNVTDDLVFETNNLARMTISGTDGHIGVGGAPTADTIFRVTGTTTGAGFGILNGLNVAAIAPGSSNVAQYNVINVTGATNYTANVGVASTVINGSTGTTSELIGFGVIIENTSTGIVDNAYGIRIDSNTNPSGTINNNYGLYIQDQAGVGTTNYNLYSAGVNSVNYIQGKLGINNTAAPNRLNVNLLHTADLMAQAAIHTGGDGNKGLIIQGDTSQTANLQEWQSSAGTPLAAVDASGRFVATTLGTADSSSYLCRNTSNQIATCSGGVTGSAFVQGGNDFGGTAILGTNSAHSLAFETGGVTHLTMDTSGKLTHTITSTSTTGTDELGHSLLFIDTGAVSSGLDRTYGMRVDVQRSGGSGAATLITYGGYFTASGDTGGTSNVAGLLGAGASGDNNTGVVGVGFQAGTATTSSIIGVSGAADTFTGTSGGTVATAYGLHGSVAMTGGQTTYTTAAGLNIASASLALGGLGTITTNYGIKIDAQTVGAANYGIRIDTASNGHTVWIGGTAAGDAGTANTGIAFGSTRDTNLYRSAADTLKTDDKLEVTEKLQVGGNSSFTECSIITGLSTCTKSFEQVLASTSTTTQTWGANFATGITPAGATNTQSNRGISSLLALYGTQSFSGANRAIFGSANNVTSSGTVSLLTGIYGESIQLGGASSTVTEGVGIGAMVSQAGSGTLTTGYGLRVMTATGTIGTNYGIHVQTQTAGTTDYGLRVDTADTQTLWISGDAANPTTASAGIAFGSTRDTNLYRSGADTLKTDDSLEVTNKLQVGTSGGTLAQCANVIGTFTCNNTLEQASASTETSVQTYGTNLVTGLAPVGATNTVENRALNASLALYGTQSFSSSSGNYGINGTAYGATTSGTIALIGGVSGGATQGGAGSTVTEAFGLQGSVSQVSGTLTTAYGMRVLSAAGTIGTNYGIHVQTQTAGTTDYGLRVDTADTQTLWVAGNDASATTAAKGIAFGSARDVTLYRGAADQLRTDDALLIQQGTSTTTALNVRASTNDNIFTVDAANGRLGINLGSNNLPTEELHVNGSALFYGSATSAYTTPVGSAVGAKIAVENLAVGGSDQVIAVGLTSGSQTNSRGISIFDARTVAHQPSIAVFSPNESDIVGFSWDGSNTTASVKVLTGSLNFQTASTSRGLFDTSNNLYLGNADTSGVASAPNAFALRGTGSSSVGTAGAALTVAGGGGASSSTGSAGGNLVLQGGAAGGSGANNGGNVTIDGGAPSGAGSYGNVIIANAGGNVMVGTNTSGGKLTVSTGAAGTTGLQIRGVASQTANLLKLADSSANTLLSVAPQGASNQRALWAIYNTLEVTPTNYERLGIYADNTNNVFRVESQNAGSGTLRDMVIQGTTGRVGIGVMNSVGYKLDVYEDRASSFAANFFNDGNDQNRNGIRIQAGADDGSGSTTYIDFLDGDGTQVGFCTNASGSFSCGDPSDARTKTNIDNSEINADQILNGLRVVDFNRIQNPDGPRITGFIAQEVQSLYGQAVVTTSSGMLGISKDQFIPVLVKGHQNQEIKLGNINDRVSNLEQQVAALSGTQGSATTVTQGGNFTDLNVSGQATVQNLRVTGAATVASLTVTGNAHIAGNITIGGHVLGNADTRGSVTVPAGQTEFKHTFVTRYTAGSQPNIILTPKNTFAPKYRVESTDADFTIYFDGPASVDVIMNYQVQE